MSPPSAYTPSSNTPWQAILHLNYSTLVILLHREPVTCLHALPPPRSSCTGTSIVNPIVAAEATTQTTTMLQTLDTIKALQQLNFFGVHAVWTTMLQLKRDVRSLNPLTASNASRTLKALLAILLELSYSWNFAQGLARLFGDTDREGDGSAVREQSGSHEEQQQQQQPTPGSSDVEPDLNESLFMDFGLLEDFFMGYEENFI